MLRVLVVDDQFLIRSGLTALLTAAPRLRGRGRGRGRRGGRTARRRDPARRLVLMDIRMPGTDGIAATGRILAEADARAQAEPEAAVPRPKVLVLTTFDSDAYVFRALRVGAGGFLLKDTPPARLLAAIATVHGGEMLLSPGALCGLIDTYAAPVTRTPHPGLDDLTPREREVLGLVGAGPSHADIAGRLVLSAATVVAYEFGLAARMP
ncbi:response regulator [Streptomyces sp. NPDC060031]|uniref:response regulator n=1 Tax=Streptomyces sp. NPDC060031 TaxID=3347043 RepID=UPI0036AEFB16